MFIRDNRGITAIEVAILLPVIILLVMAVIEFGFYFVKYQTASRAVSTISDTIQKNPAAATHSLATQQGLSILNLTSPPNYICAQSYTTEAQARSGLCTQGWVVTHPSGPAATTTYWVAVRAYAPHLSITPFTMLSDAFPPPIDAKTVIAVNPQKLVVSQSIQATTVRVQKRTNTNTMKVGGTGLAANCPSGYIVTGCSTACEGTEGEVDLSFFDQGCAVDANTKCGTSGGGNKWFYVSARCIRIVPN